MHEVRLAGSNSSHSCYCKLNGAQLASLFLNFFDIAYARRIGSAGSNKPKQTKHSKPGPIGGRSKPGPIGGWSTPVDKAPPHQPWQCRSMQGFHTSTHTNQASGSERRSQQMVRDAGTPSASDGQPWQLQGRARNGWLAPYLYVGEASKSISAKNAIGCQTNWYANI
jgi:hypothetical protein